VLFNKSESLNILHKNEEHQFEKVKLKYELRDMFVPFMEVYILYNKHKGINKYRNIRVISYEKFMGIWSGCYSPKRLKISINRKLVLRIVYQISLNDSLYEIIDIGKYTCGYEDQLKEFYDYMIHYVKEHQDKEQYLLDKEKAEQKIIVFQDI
jgi:hypothetical protein